MLLLIGFLWGFAEATLFFIVPDIFFTYLVLFDLRLADWSCFFALIGGLMGGGVMYRLGRGNFEAAARSVVSLPGVSSRLIQRERGMGYFIGPFERSSL